MSNMSYPGKSIAIVLLVAILLSAGPPVLAQSPRDNGKTWTRDSKSIAKQASEGATTLLEEPVMRIALSTGTSAATISTTACLLNVSDAAQDSQPLEVTR